jgi:hypothetical protein
VCTCRHSTDGKSGLRVELPNGVVIHVSIANATTAPRTSILRDDGPSNNITASPSSHTAPRHQRLPTSLQPEQATRGFLRRRQARCEIAAEQGIPGASPLPSRYQRTTPSDTHCPPSQRASGYRRGHGFVRRLPTGNNPTQQPPCAEFTAARPEKTRPEVMTIKALITRCFQPTVSSHSARCGKGEEGPNSSPRP